MVSAPRSHLWADGAGVGTMLVASRLAGLSALEAHYAGVVVVTQFWIVAKAPRFARPRRRALGGPGG
jgi:hypothetical protein